MTNISPEALEILKGYFSNEYNDAEFRAVEFSKIIERLGYEIVIKEPKK